MKNRFLLNNKMLKWALEVKFLCELAFKGMMTGVNFAEASQHTLGTFPQRNTQRGSCSAAHVQVSASRYE